jgi:2-isopropylmalate synthase
VQDVTRLAQEIVSSKLKIAANCAARTMQRDIAPVVEIVQRTGLAIEVCTFIGSSPIRQYAEDWTEEMMAPAHARGGELRREAGTHRDVRHRGHRARAPGDARRLFLAAIECGAKRLCLCDTVGHATPTGAANLVRFAKQVVLESGADIGLDWHGHCDRGLAVANTIAAIRAGATRVHGCAIGIGERVGNTPMDQLLVNLKLLGWIDNDLTALPDYCERTSAGTGVPIPVNYPVVGADAFRTGTGVHAAAVIKAFKKGDDWLADRVYSGVPADMVGRHQEIEVGPMSGESNVVYWLESRKHRGDTGTGTGGVPAREIGGPRPRGGRDPRRAGRPGRVAGVVTAALAATSVGLPSPVRPLARSHRAGLALAAPVAGRRSRPRPPSRGGPRRRGAAQPRREATRQADRYRNARRVGSRNRCLLGALAELRRLRRLQGPDADVELAMALDEARIGLADSAWSRRSTRPLLTGGRRTPPATGAPQRVPVPAREHVDERPLRRLVLVRGACAGRAGARPRRLEGCRAMASRAALARAALGKEACSSPSPRGTRATRSTARRHRRGRRTSSPGFPRRTT